MGQEVRMTVMTLYSVLSPPPGTKILTAVDVMRDLISNGVKQDEYLANTELEVREEEVILLDTSEGVRQELEVFLTGSISDPMAFVNRERSTLESLSRVLVFTVQGFQGACDKYNLMFAFQVGLDRRNQSVQSPCSVP